VKIKKILTKKNIIIGLLVLLLIVQLIPKFQLTFQLIDKRPKQEFICNCNCGYPIVEEEVNWSKFNFSYWENVTLSEIRIYNLSWYDECRTCWII